MEKFFFFLEKSRHASERRLFTWVETERTNNGRCSEKEDVTECRENVQAKLDFSEHFCDRP
jgi:hypothetical protein